jgi:allantoin racemase
MMSATAEETYLMRLWYQTMSRQTSWGAYSRALREILQSAKNPETEIEIYGVAAPGGLAEQFRYAESLDAAEVLENARIAAGEGFDAFLIGSMADPGLKEAREAVDIPVVGLGEATFHLAGLIGGKFALVTLEEKSTPYIVENLVQYGFRDRLSGVRRMRVERFRDIDQGFDDAAARRRVVEHFLEAARGNVPGEADLVVTAGSSVIMALLDYADIDETLDGAPILDGLTALVKLGEMAVKVTRILEGKFTAERVEVAVELMRSYDAAPRRRADLSRPTTAGSGRLLRRLNQQGPRFGG